MKKLLIILHALVFAFGVYAQQTEDDIYVGKTYTRPEILVKNPR